MPSSGTHGLPARQPSPQWESASRLRDAAMAADRSWRQALSHEDRMLAMPALAATLGELSVFCTRMSACSRLHAMNESSSQGFARAAFVHGAACFLQQAWLAISDAGTDATGYAGQSPDAPLRQAAPDCVAQWQPAATVDQEALELLADATDALASAVSALPDPPAQPLAVVHACIRAAAGQLRTACEFAPPAGTGPAAPAVPARTS
jgi:hypothetical protein